MRILGFATVFLKICIFVVARAQECGFGAGGKIRCAGTVLFLPWSAANCTRCTRFATAYSLPPESPESKASVVTVVAWGMGCKGSMMGAQSGLCMNGEWRIACLVGRCCHLRLIALHSQRKPAKGASR